MGDATNKTLKYIYKYTDVDNCIKILCNSSLYFDYPINYNDPFDTEIDIRTNYTKKDIDDVKNKIGYYEKILGKSELQPNDLKKVASELGLKKASKQDIASAFNKLNRKKKTELAKKYSKIGEMDADFVKEFIKSIVIPKMDTSKMTEGLKNLFPLCCFSTEPDILTMWSHYADSHKGVAIKFNRITDEFFQWGNEVTYVKAKPEVDYLSTVTSGHQQIKEKYLLKSIEWKYEREYRIIRPESDKEGLHKFNIDALEEIFLGINMPKTNEKILRVMVKGLGLKVKITKMQKVTRKYKVSK